MDLAAALVTKDNVAPLPELPEAWHWSLARGFDFAAALDGDGERVFQTYALRSYDEKLVTDLLAFAREHSAQLRDATGRPLTLLEGFSSPAGRPFDALVAIGPSVHKYQSENNEVHDRTVAVQPAYRCEFAGDENEEDTQYRYLRASGVLPTKLDREPQPFLKMRLITESGREIATRGFAALESLVNDVRGLGNSERFVEFENYRHEVFRVEWDGAWTVRDASGDDVQRFDFEQFLTFARDTLYGPNIGAGTSEFPA